MTNQIEAALRRSPRAAPARDAFQKRLRQQFIDGSLASSETGGTEPESLMRPVPRRSGLRLLVGAAAAVAAALLIWVSLPRDRGWRVLDLQGAEILVDGRSLDRPALANQLLSGAEIDTAEASLAVEVSDHVRMHVEPGSRLLARAPDDPEAAQALVRLDHGELFLEKMPGGEDVFIRTPSALVRVVGTRLGIEVSAGGTCVCLLEGTAEVRSVETGELLQRCLKETSHVVPAGSDAIMLKPFAEPEQVPQHVEHVDRLRTFFQ